MSQITFNCTCGKNFKFSRKFAGREFRCVKCHGYLTVPHPPAEDEEFDLQGSAEPDADPVASEPQPPAKVEVPPEPEIQVQPESEDDSFELGATPGIEEISAGELPEDEDEDDFELGMGVDIAAVEIAPEPPKPQLAPQAKPAPPKPAATPKPVVAPKPVAPATASFDEPEEDSGANEDAFYLSAVREALGQPEPEVEEDDYPDIAYVTEDTYEEKFDVPLPEATAVPAKGKGKGKGKEKKPKEKKAGGGFFGLFGKKKPKTQPENTELASEESGEFVTEADPAHVKKGKPKKEKKPKEKNPKEKKTGGGFFGLFGKKKPKPQPQDVDDFDPGTEEFGEIEPEPVTAPAPEKKKKGFFGGGKKKK